MPEELANTECRVTTRTEFQASQEVDASSVQHGKPGLKPDYPAWHKPYAEALLETDPEILVKLLAATEIAVFERFLELAANEDASDERQDIGRAIEVMLTLKARKTQAGSSRLRTIQKQNGSSANRAKLVLHHNGKIEYRRSLEIPSEGKGTAVKENSERDCLSFFTYGVVTKV